MPEYTIPLRCATKQRPRALGKGKWTYMPREYVAWKAAVAAHLRQQHTGPPLTGPLAVCIAAAYKGARRGDADNIEGAPMDAAKSILWNDDHQVSGLCFVGISKSDPHPLQTIAALQSQLAALAASLPAPDTTYIAIAEV